MKRSTLRWKRALASALCASVIACAAHAEQAPAPETTVMWAAKRSNVRAGPGTEHTKVGLLEVGEEVRARATAGEWIELEPDITGEARFVHRDLLEGPVPEPPALESAPAKARVETPQGTTYRGEMHDGKRHGHGVQTWPGGARYEGQWRGGMPEGHGVKTWPDGARHQGVFRAGKRHGAGRYQWPNGDEYEGQWRDDEKVGVGIMRWADGDASVVEWRDGEALDIHVPDAPCATIERGTESAWANRCDVGVDVAWSDDGPCRARHEGERRCAIHIAANARQGAVLAGEVLWDECLSPQGEKSVRAVRKRRRHHCMSRVGEISRARDAERRARAEKGNAR